MKKGSRSPKRMDPCVTARRQQRDEAAGRYSQAQARLASLQREGARLGEERREQLRACVGRNTLDVADLERMDLARRAAELATQATELAASAAKEETLHCHRRLRQVELLRERLAEVESEEKKRDERRSLDELARLLHARLPLLFVAMVLLALMTAMSGCPSAEAQAEEGAGVDSVGEKSSDTQIGADSAELPTEFSAAEVELLGKLRRRAEALAKKKRDLELRDAKLTLLKKKLDEALAKLEAERKQKKKTEGDKKAPMNLVQVLSKMSPRPASAMLAQMDPQTAAAALSAAFPAEEIARVLGQMAPEEAARVAVALYQRRGGSAAGRRARRSRRTEAKRSTRRAAGDAGEASAGKAKSAEGEEPSGAEAE